MQSIDSQLYTLMSKAGLKLKPVQIYNSNGSSLKDAVVALDGGSCSGSIISSEGLLITNHHCAYSDIHALSTPEHNYLENGYWALTRSKELPIAGKSVTFLKYVTDVTDECKPIVDSMDKRGKRPFRYMGRLEKRILSKLYRQPESYKYEFSLSSTWGGQKYYLYVYQTFNDVRLVGAPPVSVAAFGNDVDNWNWPQHKCDFAMYRVYTAPDGSPAKYSSENVPLNSASAHLKIASEVVKEGDYAMVMGYPYTTNRYISSEELKFQYNHTNNTVYDVRSAKLQIIKKFMESDPLLRLKYADTYFSVSNYSDYARWQNICIAKQNIIGEIEKREASLTQWLDSEPLMKEKYGSVLPQLKEYFKLITPVEDSKDKVIEVLSRGCSAPVYALRLQSLASRLKKKQGPGFKADTSDQEVRRIARICASDLAHSDFRVEREITYTLLKWLDENGNHAYLDKGLVAFLDKNRDSLKEKIWDIYDKTAFHDSLTAVGFFADGITLEKINNEPLVKFREYLNTSYLNKATERISAKAHLNYLALKRLYKEAIYTMYKEKGIAAAPDANSTMRVTYGNVKSIDPLDGVHYSWLSTSEGIKQKRDTTVYDFNMYPAVYEKVIEEPEAFPVNFITTNDITGGNSGSPVLDARGELIGLAFDGNRDGMGCDLYFSDKYCRTVNVDIRYILWYLKNYAQPLIDELQF